MAGLFAAFFWRKMALTHMEIGLHAIKLIASDSLRLCGWRLSAAGAFNRVPSGLGQCPLPASPIQTMAKCPTPVGAMPTGLSRLRYVTGLCVAFRRAPLAAVRDVFSQKSSAMTGAPGERPACAAAARADVCARTPVDRLRHKPYGIAQPDGSGAATGALAGCQRLTWQGSAFFLSARPALPSQRQHKPQPARLSSSASLRRCVSACFRAYPQCVHR